jgi:hypothetical protein
LILHSGCDGWPRVVGVVAGFHGPGCCGGRRDGCRRAQPGAGRASSRRRPSRTRPVNGAGRARCSQVRRPVAARRPAIESSRWRRRLGSQRRAAWSVRARVCIQATRSPARGDDRAPDLVGPEGTAFKPSAAADTPGQTLAAATGWRTVTVGWPSPANAAGRGTARSGPRRSTACRLPGRRGHHRAHRTYGRGKGAVLRLLEVNGVARRRQSLTPEHVQEAIRLYGLGWPLGRIGERFGRHHSVVLRALERAGVPRRDSHGTER